MPAGLYSCRVMDHFQSPRNCGEMKEPDGVGEAINPVCGDRMRLYLRVEGDSIRKAAFLAEGCVAAIAAASMTTLLVEGQSLDGATLIRDADVAKALGGLPESKIHCSILAEDAIQSAVEDARSRKNSGQNQERGS